MEKNQHKSGKPAYISMKSSFWGESGKESTEDKPIKINFKRDYSPLHQGKIKLNMSIFQCLGLFQKVIYQ